MSITLRQRLKALAGGLMPRVVFEKLAMFASIRWSSASNH